MDSETASQPMVVLVDDDRSLCILTKSWLEESGYRVEVFHDGASGLMGLRQTLPDVVCLDLKMPGLSGLETLQEIRDRHLHVPVIMLTAETGVESVVSAMQLGAYDYLVKPIERTRLETAIKNAVDRHSMSLRVIQLEREVEGRGYAGIIGESDAMKRVFAQMDRVVTSDITVLLHGESGTGKELVARALHEKGGRGRHPFIAVNCGAIPETLQESEVFGHEKGAFTGATAQRRGKFELADKGTLFLDEVAELSPSMQAKLLRVLQDRTFQRVGGSVELRSDFRLITATHRDLEKRVEEGTFREDLYYRIAVFELELPPLRHRHDDVAVLAERFLSDLGRREGRSVELAEETAEILQTYSWPGNVRELQNSIERAWVASDGQLIRPADLPRRVLRDSGPRVAAETAPGAGDEGEDLTLEGVEKRAIEKALRASRGNVSLACRKLGIGRATIYRKIKKYDLRWES